jgi:hypothetical protein
LGFDLSNTYSILNNYFLGGGLAMESMKLIKLGVSVVCLLIMTGNLTAQDSQLTSAATMVVEPADKLSFRLAALAQSPTLKLMASKDQGAALSLPPSGPGSLRRDAQGRVLVYIRMDDISGDQIQALQDAGAQIMHVSERYMVITAMIDTSYLLSVASLTAVQGIQEVLSPLNNSTCPTGAAVSEGIAQLNAALARSNYGIDGSGVQVGILSDSYNQHTTITSAAGDVISGDLPGAANTCGYTTEVNVFQDYTSGIDEGRAMTQIVHDLAPGSAKSFATAYYGVFAFADNIRNLRSAGADIIADDVYYFAEPFFQEGPVNVAISDVVSAGALHFTSAGNANLIINGNNISSYEAQNYRPTACPVPLTGVGLDCHNFDPSGGVSSTSSITLGNSCKVVIDFQWNEPWYGVITDFDIYLIDASNTQVASSKNRNIISTQEPFEFLSYTNNTGGPANFRIVINRYSGSGMPRLKYVFLQNGNACISSVQYNTSNGSDIVGPSLNGHSASDDGFSVAAVPYYNSNTPESYSSHGPATHYYGPVVGTTPASAIAPDVLQQPDFAATDGGCNTFFGGFSAGCYRFYGTSAAAPHAAAVTALLKQRANQLSMPLTRMVTKYVLQTTARTVIGGDINSVGAGLIDANAAVAKLSNLEPVIRIKSSTIVGGYSAIQTAYDNSSSSGDIIEMIATAFPGDLFFNASRDVILSGGYASGYSSQTGNTVVQGTLRISNGTVTVDRLVLN